MKNLIKTLWGELKFYVLITLIVGVIIFFIMRNLYCLFPNICIAQKVADFIGISITYFMTVLAFSITAFALTQLIAGNSSFVKLQKTDTYKKVLALFRDTTAYHIFVLPISFIIYFSYDYFPISMKFIAGAILISLIMLSLGLIKKITNVLFILLSPAENKN